MRAIRTCDGAREEGGEQIPNLAQRSTLLTRNTGVGVGRPPSPWLCASREPDRHSPVREWKKWRVSSTLNSSAG